MKCDGSSNYSAATTGNAVDTSISQQVKTSDACALSVESGNHEAPSPHSVARRNPALALTAAALKAKDADNADG